MKKANILIALALLVIANSNLFCGKYSDTVEINVFAELIDYEVPADTNYIYGGAALMEGDVNVGLSKKGLDSAHLIFIQAYFNMGFGKIKNTGQSEIILNCDDELKSSVRKQVDGSQSSSADLSLITLSKSDFDVIFPESILIRYDKFNWMVVDNFNFNKEDLDLLLKEKKGENNTGILAEDYKMQIRPEVATMKAIRSKEWKIKIGATLHIKENQESGEYTGLCRVIVKYKD
ncbi:MAG: DUF4402 domain-containing protein [bacterium]